ncbi:MAG: response regulator transcription factor [Alphaproteobacteria bacterium]|nr:response regulator transcription factor [Alphaproteobacteria bacterium]
MANLLLVDDERDLLTPLVYALEREGHECTLCETGEDALDALGEERWDLVVLDLMLPDISGAEICRRIRSTPRTRMLPVIIVSARGDEFDRVVGFELGADDYVTKPFSLRELSLRITALLRRGGGAPSAEVLDCEEIELDLEAHVCRVAGLVMPLTALEIRLLEAFMRHPGRAQTRGELRDSAWGNAYRIGERAVDTNVKRLRQKLGDAGRFIETVRGVGYRWGSGKQST